MYKYLRSVLLAITYSSVYRAEIFLSLSQGIIAPMFMLFAVSSATSTNIAWHQLVPYYILVSLTFPLFKSQVDEDIGQLAASGDIVNFLTKPLSPYLFFLSQETGKKIMSFIWLLPLFAGAFYVFHYTISSPIYLFLSLILSFLINYNISYLFGLGSFWIDEFWVIGNLRHVMVTLLGGLVLPYSFFPEKLVSILKYTPFPYTLNFATRVISGQALPADFVIATVWLLIIIFLIRLLERKAIAKYSFIAN